MKRIFCLVLFILTYINSISQNPLDIIERYSIDTAAMASFIKEQKLSMLELDKKNDIHICFCLYMEDKVANHDKEDYLNGVFLDSLYLVWSHKNDYTRLHDISNLTDIQKTNYLPCISWYSVVDSNDVILGLGPDLYQSCYSVPYRENLVCADCDPTRFLINKSVDIIFKIRKPYYCYFIYGINISKNQVYIIVNTRWGAEMFPIEEIINNHWEDFQNGLTNLFDEVHKRKEAEHMLHPE